MKKLTKAIANSAAAAALASCMVCAAPAISMAAPAENTQTTYSALAKSTNAMIGIELKAGQQTTFTKVFFGTKTVKASKCKWASSNKKVATVKKGLVKAMQEGKATITATYKGKKVKIAVEVTMTEAAKKLEDVKQVLLNGTRGEDGRFFIAQDPATESKGLTVLYYNPDNGYLDFGNTCSEDQWTLDIYIDDEGAIGFVIVDNENNWYVANVDAATYTKDTSLDWKSLDKDNIDEATIAALNKHAAEQVTEINSFMTNPANNLGISLADVGFTAFK